MLYHEAIPRTNGLVSPEFLLVMVRAGIAFALRKAGWMRLEIAGRIGYSHGAA